MNCITAPGQSRCYTMEKYEEGLHKEVSLIFHGMRGFRKGGVQLARSKPSRSSTGYHHKRLPAQEKHIQAKPQMDYRGRLSWKGIRPKWSRLPAVMKVFVQILQHVCPSRAKRREKRFVERRKHLLMNLQSEQTAGAVGCSPGAAPLANQAH